MAGILFYGMKKFFRLLFDTAWTPIVLCLGAVAFSVLCHAAFWRFTTAWQKALIAFSVLLLPLAALLVAVAFVRALLQRCWRRALVLALFAALGLLFAVA
ncbi:MAG: hypothetical protein IJS32_05380 [Kiritimatiellae bacterium]|nr:hypothetical protein [Kiritimatiellia bacterium]